MNNQCLIDTKRSKPITQDAVLKTTALLYFKEALENQIYEDCRELIDTAKKFGARQSEVRKVILEHIRGVKVAEENRTEQKIGGHLRFE